jgi:hypothetical protein
VVRNLAKRRRGRDDGRLCRDPVAADRRQAELLQTRQADRDRRRRASWFIAIGATLQAGATGAVKTVKMSSKLLAAKPLGPAAIAIDGDQPAPTEPGRLPARRLLRAGPVTGFSALLVTA